MGLDVGQVLSRAFSMFTSRFGPLVGLWFVFFVVQIVATLLLGGLAGFGALGAVGMSGDPSALGAGFFVSIGLFYVMYLLIYCAQSTAMSAMASPLLEPSFGDSFGRGIRTAPTFFAALVLLIIVYLILTVIGTLVLGLLGSVSSTLGMILGIALIPVVVYLACRLAVISPVIGVEQTLNPIKAIARTWAMTRGNVLGIFLTLLVFIIGAGILIAVLFFAGFGGLMASLETGAAPGIGSIIGLMVTFLVFSILLTVLGAALISSLHEALSGHDGESLTETFG